MENLARDSDGWFGRLKDLVLFIRQRIQDWRFEVRGRKKGTFSKAHPYTHASGTMTFHYGLVRPYEALNDDNDDKEMTRNDNLVDATMTAAWQRIMAK